MMHLHQQRQREIAILTEEVQQEQPKPKSIVDRLNDLDTQIARLNKDVLELRAVINQVKSNMNNNNNPNN